MPRGRGEVFINRAWHFIQRPGVDQENYVPADLGPNPWFDRAIMKRASLGSVWGRSWRLKARKREEAGWRPDVREPEVSPEDGCHARGTTRQKL